jgi:hypothetical protein
MSSIDVALCAKWRPPLLPLLLLVCVAQGSLQGGAPVPSVRASVRPTRTLAPGSHDLALHKGGDWHDGVSSVRGCAWGVGLVGCRPTARGESGGEGRQGLRPRLRLRGGVGEGSTEEFVERARSLLEEAGGAMYSTSFEESWDRKYPGVELSR